MTNDRLRLQARAAQLRRLPLKRLDVDQDDAVTAPGQQGGRRKSDALRRSRNQNGFGLLRHAGAALDCMSRQICTA